MDILCLLPGENVLYASVFRLPEHHEDMIASLALFIRTQQVKGN